MNRVKPFLFSVLLAAACAVSAAEPETIRFEGAAITPLQLPAVAGSSGYSAISARVRNTLDVPIEVGMLVSGRMFGGSGLTASSENAVLLAPGSETIMDVPFPNSWNRAEVKSLTVDAKELADAPELFPTSGGGRHKTVMLEIEPEPGRVPAPSNPGQAAARARERLQLRQGFDAVTEAYSPVSEWSADPIAYTGFTMISIPDYEFAAATPDVRLALEKYMLLGGTLELTGAKRAFPRKAMFGEYIGNIRLPEPLPETAFGSRPGRPEPAAIGLDESGTGAITLGVLVLFAATATVSAMALRRKNKLLLFFTVPAVSLLAAAAIFAVTLVREGSGIRVAIESKTMIDADTGIAATETEYLFFAPMTQNPDLEFSSDTLVTAAADANYRWGGGRLRIEGMLASHTPTRVTARRVFKTEAGVQITINSDSRPTAVNHLGATVIELSCRINGKEYSAPSESLPIPDGGTAELFPADRRAEAGPDGFTAKLTAPAFIEPGLAEKPAILSSAATVCGTFAREVKP
ncbi:MAG: hypothetical protein AB7F40_10760 [Victivallaceae bacterium]|nr:hypothetical protein [Victivallaceae bacterium]